MRFQNETILVRMALMERLHNLLFADHARPEPLADYDFSHAIRLTMPQRSTYCRATLRSVAIKP